MKKPIKKPVGDQSIASAREIRQIDPIWSPGPVPKWFWEDPQNRRNYLLWLSHKLNCRKMKDLYRLTYGDLHRNHGSGLASRYWRASLIEGIKECFPEYDWQEWLFKQALKSFWHDKRNHRRYMTWLGEQLGIRCPDDWYRVKTDDFFRFGGGAFLIYYRSSVSLAVKAYLPKYDWKEWLFNRTPMNFWRSRENRFRYMRWLGTVLGYKHLDDWYNVTYEDFNNHCGKDLLVLYHKSPVLAVVDLIPRKEWHEWKFNRVPTDFWKAPQNRRRYMDWLGKQLKFRRPEDWRKIRNHHFHSHCGGGLFAEIRSCVLLLREYLPQIDWDHWECTCPLTEEQILLWAEDYYQQHGSRPFREAGTIPGTRQTWDMIHVCLKEGKRGLRGGRSLAQFLRENA
jgi:hypothetical protein